MSDVSDGRATKGRTDLEDVRRPVLESEQGGDLAAEGDDLGEERNVLERLSFVAENGGLASRGKGGVLEQRRDVGGLRKSQRGLEERARWRTLNVTRYLPSSRG